MEKTGTKPDIGGRLEYAIEQLLKADHWLVVTIEEVPERTTFSTFVAVSSPIAVGSLTEVARQMTVESFIRLPDDEEEPEET